MSTLFTEQPPLHLIDSEADTLSNLALHIARNQPELSQRLLEEINRAEIHSATELPAKTVTMNCRVTFVDQGNGSRRTVQLVYPQDADIEAGRVSILTPVGAGLIGLGEGQTIIWPDRDGHERPLLIERVVRGDAA